MINDIFATNMHGRYATMRNGDTVEEGEWSYRGYGNAEIALVASAVRPASGLRFDVRLHSAERQMDEIYFRRVRDGEAEREFTAIIGGSMVSLREKDSHSDREVMTAPSETIYVGPSPIWLIHLLMVDPPPDDREVITPVVGFTADDPGIRGGFYRCRRTGSELAIDVLDRAGAPLQRLDVSIAEDGCPTTIRDGDEITEIIRLPQ